MISPSLGVSSPVMMRMRLVLPAPLRPSRQMRSPGLDLEIDLVEQRGGAVFERDLAELKQRHGLGTIRGPERMSRRFVASGRGGRRGPAGEHLAKEIEAHGLGRGNRPCRRRGTCSLVAVHRVGGHGDDARAWATLWPARMLPGGLVAVHLRHLAIHEDDVVGIFFERREHLEAVGGEVGGVAEILQQAERRPSG